MEFDYTALDAQGQRQRSILHATDEAQALVVLEQRRLQVIEIRPRRTRAHLAASVRVDAAYTARLAEEMSTLLEAGVPLAEAVATLARGLPDEHPLRGVLLALRGGGIFSQAMAASGLFMPVYVVQLLRAGESTGQLAQALRAAAEHLEADLAFAREARNALVYPSILVGSGLVATLVMFVFVVPRFASVLQNPKADLPLVSQWVLSAGLWLTQHQLWVLGVCVVLAAVLVWASGLPGVRAWCWEQAARLPVLGRWVWHAELARWASLLGVLLGSKVPLLTALGQANETLRRMSLRAQAQQVWVDVRGGRPLSEALAAHPFLDGSGLSLIQVGERAGSLPRTVASLARIHAQHSQQLLKRLLVLVEPLMILLISVILGGVMISVMLAITSLTNVL